MGQIKGSLRQTWGGSVETCQTCGGRVKVIACIEDPKLIQKILTHLNAKNPTTADTDLLPEPRAPPQAKLFAWSD